MSAGYLPDRRAEGRASVRAVLPWSYARHPLDVRTADALRALVSMGKTPLRP
jgi:hypothetical protein